MVHRKVLCVVGTRPGGDQDGAGGAGAPAPAGAASAGAAHRPAPRPARPGAGRCSGCAPDVDLDVDAAGPERWPAWPRASWRHATAARRASRPTWCWRRATRRPSWRRRSPASTAGIPFGHVEAGLRTGDCSDPFPEEMNRSSPAALATLHSRRPTARRRQPAAGGRAGGAHPRHRQHRDRRAAACRRARRPRCRRPPRTAALVLVTVHRRESFGDAAAERCCRALRRLLRRRFPDVQLLYPVHPNPQRARPGAADARRPPAASRSASRWTTRRSWPRCGAARWC